jgi:hyperosmotically inducible protein
MAGNGSVKNVTLEISSASLPAGSSPTLGLEVMRMWNRAARLVLTGSLILAFGFAAKKDHNDAFTSGDPTESRIAQQVRHQLVMLPYYGVFDDLAFKLEGGTVTLLGAVTRPVLKSDAENVVKRIEGVTQVVNEIKVLPPSPMDDQTRRAVYRAIYGDPSLSIRYGYRAVPSIHIIVENGRVTLEGVVANETDKSLCNLRANGVPNVFSVTNDLRVEGQ